MQYAILQYCNMKFLTLCLVGSGKIANFTPENNISALCYSRRTSLGNTSPCCLPHHRAVESNEQNRLSFLHNLINFVNLQTENLIVC